MAVTDMCRPGSLGRVLRADGTFQRHVASPVPDDVQERHRTSRVPDRAAVYSGLGQPGTLQRVVLMTPRSPRHRRETELEQQRQKLLERARTAKRESRYLDFKEHLNCAIYSGDAGQCMRIGGPNGRRVKDQSCTASCQAGCFAGGRT